MNNQGHHILSLDQDQDYGQVMRYYRKYVKRWTAEQLGEIYGNLIYGHPMSGRMIQLMEKNNALPTDPKRREILARLLDIPLAKLGLGTVVATSDASKTTLENMLRYASRRRSIDIIEYTEALDTFWDNYYTSTVKEATQDAVKRVSHLHNGLAYTSSIEKIAVLRLLCSYQIALANIAHDQRHYQTAIRFMNNALAIARENGYYDLQADALVMQGHVYRSYAHTFPDQENINLITRYLVAALRKYTAITEIERYIGPKMNGFARTMIALTQALLSQNRVDVAQSLKMFDAAEKKLEVAQREGGSRVIRFDIGDYHYDKASTLMASPIKELRSPDLALDEMAQAADLTPLTFKNRYVGIYTRQAKMYLEKGYYPMATALANDALVLAKDIQEDILFARIAFLYKDLKASSFGNNFEVAQLGAELMKVQYPYLF